MFVPFQSVREGALLALYRLTYASERQEYFQVSDISSEADLRVGNVFFNRALKDLVEEGLIDTSDYEENDLYYSLTNSRWSAAEKLALGMLKSEDRVEGVPASDRVVAISDNQHTVLHSGLDELVTEIKTSNEIGSVLGTQRDRVVAELEAGNRLVAARSIRLGALISALATPLRFLAEKFGGAAAGELAKKLLAELWKMISS